MPFELATANDLPRLAELLSGGAPAPDTVRGIGYALEHPERGVILVAREGDSLTACAYLAFTVSTAEGGPVAVLQNFQVDPAFQNRGIGTRLLDSIFEYVSEHGLLRITLWTETLGELARNFFRKRGFADSAMIPLRRISRA